jgi:hypothetical protein
MPAPCGVPLGLCAMRLTRLDDNGCVAASPNNSFVSTKALSLTLTPVIEAGADLTLTGGCDCIIASYRGVDKLKRFEFEVTNPSLAPAMYEMMIGGTAFGEGGFITGLAWPAELACGEDANAVALEFWVKHWIDNAQDISYPWIHHVYPRTYWQIGQQQFQNDFAQPTLTGFTRKNDCWGNGPYPDGPEEEGYGSVNLAQGGFFYSTIDPPTDSDCDYADVTPAS